MEDKKLLTYTGLQSLVSNILSFFGKKFDIEQGADNAGKIIAVDESGNAVPSNAPEAVDIVYHGEERILEFVTKTQLPGNVSVDPTLATSGNAADSKAVGEKIAELEEKDMILETASVSFVDDGAGNVSIDIIYENEEV